MKRKEDFPTHICKGTQFKEASSQDDTKDIKRMSFIKRKFRRVVISSGREKYSVKKFKRRVNKNIME
jgi:hypothetical protein